MDLDSHTVLAVAIVTGGSTRAGRDVARVLASWAWPIVIVYLDHQARVEATVAEIIAAGGAAVAVRADLNRSGKQTREHWKVPSTSVRGTSANLAKPILQVSARDEAFANVTSAFAVPAGAGSPEHVCRCAGSRPLPRSRGPP